MNTREVINDLENLKVFESLVDTMRTIGSGLYPKLEKKLRPVNRINDSSHLAMNLVYSYTKREGLNKFKDQKISKTFAGEHQGGVCVLTIGSNRAFCGDLNRKIIRKTNEIITELKNANQEYFLVTIGKKLANSFPEIPQQICKNYEFPEKILKTDNPEGLVSYMENLKGFDFAKLIIVFTKLVKANGSIKTEQSDIQLIPFVPDESFKTDITKGDIGLNRKLVLEPDNERAIHHAIEQYLFTNILFSLLNSYTCENYMRMNSMNQASKSIKDEIIRYHRMISKERKRVITKNLIEVISASIQEKELEKQIR